MTNNPRGNCIYCKGHGWNWQLPPGMNAFAMRMEAITRLSRKVTCHCCLGTGSSEFAIPVDNTAIKSEEPK